MIIDTVEKLREKCLNCMKINVRLCVQGCIDVYMRMCNSRMYHNCLYCLLISVGRGENFLSENCDKIVYHIFNHDNLLL